MYALFRAYIRRIKLLAIVDNCVALIAICSLIYTTITSVEYIHFYLVFQTS